MGRKQGPRAGSMQIWPRKKAGKFLPRVNWNPILTRNLSSKSNLLGFIGYKAGMASAFVKDNTPDSMTKGKKIIVPVTILECPPMKILSVRFYKDKKIMKEVLNDNLDKELIRIIRMPKKKIPAKELIEKIEKEANFDDVDLIVYSESKKSEIKKTPDLSEVGISGKKEEKLAFIKENLGKEISIPEVFQKGLVDLRGLTKGKGFRGSVKRFGVAYRSHKAEKGQRTVGSVGAWHPIGIRFTVPRPGQLGLFTRVHYNQTIVASKKFDSNDINTKRVFENYGKLNTDYLIVSGSVQGPQKRQILITSALRPNKFQNKKSFELIELR
jgi:large subunit ribosomal protein L3